MKVIRPARELPDSNVFTEFSKSELDAIAPLQQGDASSMGEDCFPNRDAIDRMDARIKAAKGLKYGVSA